MEPVTRNEIETRRGRLLGAVFIVLAGFAGLAVMFSLFGPDFFEPLRDTPQAVRLGILGLAVGFIGLVSEQDRALRRREDELTEQQLMITSFESRLQVLDGLLDASDRLNVPLSINGVLDVILDTAVDLSGAQSGTVDYWEKAGQDLAVGRQKVQPSPRWDRKGASFTLGLPLMADDRQLGFIHLVLAEGEAGLDPAKLDTVTRFAQQAGQALEKARYLEEQRASSSHLEAANEVKSRFLTTASHELRTPLTSIIGYAGTLDHHWDKLADTQKLEFVGQIRKHGSELARLVERILEAARVELHGIVIDPVVHDVRQSVVEAVSSFHTEELDRIHIHVPDGPLHAKVDPFVVDQVICNLVDNALRHTPGDVQVTLASGRSWITLSVADAGPGMTPDQVEHIMEPLYRVEHRIGSGTGLGLHIVREFVEGHGGATDIRSEPNGTRVVVTVPCLVAERAENGSVVG